MKAILYKGKDTKLYNYILVKYILVKHGVKKENSCKTIRSKIINSHDYNCSINDWKLSV